MADYPPPAPGVIEACIAAFREEHHRIKVFGNGVRDFFATHPTLASGGFPPIHSVKFRIKDEEHIRSKIIRKKLEENRDITPDNLFKEITDLAGVRVLHLHKEQFVQIHKAIEDQIQRGYWFPLEPPTAYTWDPDSSDFFKSLGLPTVIKDSHYTSVHYVIKPNDMLPTACEIQVRTLFEEVWGEIDHVINYPIRTTSVACKEELRVLAKMVGAGSRLCEAIFRSHRDFTKK